MINTQLVSMDCEITVTKDHRDIMTADYFIAIVNLSVLDESALNNLQQFYTEVDGNLTVRIFINPQQHPIAKDAHAQVFKTFSDFEPNMPGIIQKAHKRAKNEINTIQNMMYTMLIISQIQDQPGITTTQLMQLIDRNSATVRRHIDALKVMGIRIDYNPQTTGWTIL
jgi:hypothetical protein